MHRNCVKNVRRFQTLYTTGRRVLYVGSWSNNPIDGRSLWPGKDYLGVDVQPGPNVDQVVPIDGDWDLGEFDVVTSLNTFEHCQSPTQLIRRIAKHTKVGGFAFMSTHWVFFYHRFPVDNWRISPDGWRVLCEDAGLHVVETYFSRHNLRDSLYFMVRHQMRPVDSVCIATKE